MSETKDITQGVVASVGDSDLVLVTTSGGGLKPVSFANLMKAAQKSLSLARTTALRLEGGEWVRVAKCFFNATFCGILSVSHSWSSGKPVPLFCAINGSANNADGFNAEMLVSGGFFAPSASNQSMSFRAVRFVKEGTTMYVEIKFKDGASTNNVYTSLGSCFNLDLVDASISAALDSNVLKTIDFESNWGGGKTLFFNQLRNFTERRAAA